MGFSHLIQDGNGRSEASYLSCCHCNSFLDYTLSRSCSHLFIKTFVHKNQNVSSLSLLNPSCEFHGLSHYKPTLSGLRSISSYVWQAYASHISYLVLMAALLLFLYQNNKVLNRCQLMRQKLRVSFIRHFGGGAIILGLVCSGCGQLNFDGTMDQQ